MLQPAYQLLGLGDHAPPPKRKPRRVYRFNTKGSAHIQCAGCLDWTPMFGAQIIRVGIFVQKELDEPADDGKTTRWVVTTKRTYGCPRCATAWNRLTPRVGKDGKLQPPFLKSRMLMRDVITAS